MRCPSGKIDGFAIPRTLAKIISIVVKLFANFLSMAKRVWVAWNGLFDPLFT